MYIKYKYTYMSANMSTIELLLLYHTLVNVYEYNLSTISSTIFIF